MTKKRYSCKWNTEWGNITDELLGYNMNVKEVCDKLNKLTEKNKQLKQENQELKYYISILLKNGWKKLLMVNCGDVE